MATQIFRLCEDSNRKQTIQGWEATSQYDSKSISNIKDPNGDTPRREITSIPTPWARMDLLKLAFKEVARLGVNGTTVYHRLVSDALDVAEIFFNIDKLRDKFELLTWNVNEGIEEMLGSPRDGVKLMGKGLSVYKKADAEKYNFEQAESIFLLNYIGPGYKEQPCIVGATSPATMFLSAAGDFHFISKQVCFGDDRPFDSDLCPLHERKDMKFIEFWYAYRAKFNSDGSQKKAFSEAFPELNDYLDACEALLKDEELRKNLRDEKELCDRFDPETAQFLQVTPGNNSERIEILKIELYKPKEKAVGELSDFVIASTRKSNEKELPLVLPCEGAASGYKKLTYLTAAWNADCKAPESDPRPLKERTLPADGRTYPYLTLGDFLEDTLLVNQRPGNKEKYFMAHQEGLNAAFLPIKPLWFEYFDEEDLKECLKMEWKTVDKTMYCSVTLRVPIKNDKRGVVKAVEFTKQYMPDEQELVRLTVGIYPFVKQKVSPRYHIAAFATAQESGAALIDVKAFTKDAPYTPLAAEVSKPNTNESGRSRSAFPLQPLLYQVKDSLLDFLEVVVNGVRGVLLPHWNVSEGYKKHIFAVDFGTSNTHIEGKDSDGHVFDSDALWSSARFIFSHEADLTQQLPSRILRQQLFPYVPDADKASVTFPTRTVLAFADNKVEKDWKDESIMPLLSGNIPFAYQTETLLDYQRAVTNLKWDANEESKGQLRCFLSNLLLMIRNKVLLDQGDLTKTEIRWFYPLSMSKTKVGELQEIWNKLYKHYFGGEDDNVKKMCESEAPLGYYLRKEGTTEETCLVDIGGGTTDIAFANEGKVQTITSMRYAAGSLWGLDFNTEVSRNGFVRQYEEYINERLENYPDLLKVSQKLVAQNNSVEVLDFWISLAQSTMRADGQSVVDLTEKISNDEAMKPVFLLFYAAILYHIAQVVKVKGYEIPRHIGFSGNGSRILRVIGGRGRAEILTEFSRKFLEKVTGKTAHPKFKLVFAEQPKELTCKGGLDYSAAAFEEQENLREKRITLRGDVEAKNDDAKTKAPVVMDYTTKLSDIDDKVYKGVKEEVANFLKELHEVEGQISGGYRELFDFPNGQFGKMRAPLLVDVEKYTRDAVLRRKADAGEEETLEETLFFYPIVGMIQEWARIIAGID